MRITSQQLRKMILATEGPLLPGELPELLALYRADGTPLDLGKDNTRMLWRGEWESDAVYDMNDVVIDEGDLFILKAPSAGPGGISPFDENVDPNSIVQTRTSHTYAFQNYDFNNTPILVRDIPFTDLASAPVGEIFVGAKSKMVTFDVEPSSPVVVTLVGGRVIGYRDTGIPGPGNSVVDGWTPHFSPWAFRVPEGIKRMTLEVESTVTSITISGTGVSYDHDGAVDAADSPMGEIAFPLRNGTRVYPGVNTHAYFFFDLVTGGTVTITDAGLYNELTKLYSATGEFLGQNFYGAGTFGSVLVVNDLPPGRYYLFDQEAIYYDPGDYHPTVVLSNGAAFAPVIEGLEYWDVLFRASSGPEGPRGPKGDKGDTGDDGPAGPATTFFDAFAGDWVAGNYAAGKVVRYSNGLYMASINLDALSEPGVSANWKLLVQGV